MSDGPLRDLRRGLLRSAPFLVLGSATLVFPPAGATVCTLVLACWVGVTLIEGWGARRSSNRSSVACALVGVWVLALVVICGGAVQIQYLVGLWKGRGPAQALMDVHLSGVGALAICVGAVVTASFLALHTAVAIQGGRPNDPRELACGLLLGQSVLLGAVVACLGARTGAELLMLFGGTSISLPPLLWTVVVVIRAITYATDDAEARWWPPPEAA